MDGPVGDVSSLMFHFEHHQISVLTALAAHVAVIRAADICFLSLSLSFHSLFFLFPGSLRVSGPPSEEDVENEISDSGGGEASA